MENPLIAEFDIDKYKLPRYFGLLSLSNGSNNKMLDSKGDIIGETTIDSHYFVKISPSFMPPSFLVFINRKCSSNESNLPKYGNCFFGVLEGMDKLLFNTYHIANISNNPLLAILNGINLIIPDTGNRFLDGISYIIKINGYQFEANLRIENPTNPVLKEIEASIINISEKVANDSRDKKLIDYVKLLKRKIGVTH